LGIGILGSKGGIGTTTVAVNMATSLAQVKQRPILADFQLGTGAVAAQFGLTGKLDGMATILTRPVPEIRGPLVMQHLMNHPTGARVLASSADPKEAHTKYPLDAAFATVKALKGLGTHIFCDLGTGYTELTAKLLGALDKLVVLVEPIPMAMGAAEQLLNALRSDFAGKPILLVVVNRSPLARYTITWTDVEARLGQSVAGMVSAAPEVAYQALETGQPIVVLQPNAVVSNQLIKLAQTVQN
jgi:pilus assembly protein CpaE